LRAAGIDTSASDKEIRTWAVHEAMKRLEIGDERCKACFHEFVDVARKLRRPSAPPYTPPSGTKKTGAQIRYGKWEVEKVIKKYTRRDTNPTAGISSDPNVAVRNLL